MNEDLSMTVASPATPIALHIDAAVAAPAAASGELSTVMKMAADKLTVTYGTKIAVREVTVAVPERSILALIGPSGSGKSTVLRCFNRMNDLIPGAAVSGSLTLDGEDITPDDIDVVELRRRVGMVFQRPNPFPMTIFENVAYGPRRRGLKDKKKLEEIVTTSLIRAALWDEVKDDYRKKSGLALSGGQQQRLCIARVLATEPEVILMDEPASALDPIATSKIEELIFDLKKQYTIVIVTHNMQQAARVSDFTAFFLLGKLIEVNTTETMFTAPEQKLTEDYITGRFG